MSHLSSLKLIAGKRQLGANPKEARRMKLCSKIDEQIRLAQVMLPLKNVLHS